LAQGFVLSRCVRDVSCSVAMARVVALASLLFAGVGATELTKETWDDAVAGKTIFVKFLAPW